jgi:hypothetical protein
VSSDQKMMATVILRHDQSKTLEEIMIYSCMNLLGVQARHEPERKRAASESDIMPTIWLLSWACTKRRCTSLDSICWAASTRSVF